VSDASIVPCHNNRSCELLISAGTFRQAIRCLSPNSATIGQASHRRCVCAGPPNLPHRASYYAGPEVWLVVYWRQAKQFPSADAFPRKPSPSSLSQSVRTGEFPSASAQAGSPGPASGLDRRGGSGVITCGAQLDRTGIAGCRCASTAGKKLIRH